MKMAPIRMVPPTTNASGRLWTSSVTASRDRSGAADPGGRITSFRLDVRPVRFSHGFTTSYLCDARGELRATDEDRAAEHTDKNRERDDVLEVERPYYCVGQRQRR